MILTAAPNAWPLCRLGLRPAAATSATVSGTSYTYTYRGDGLRNSATTGGNTTTFSWDINAGLPQVLDDGSQYVYGNGLISQVAGGSTYYYLTDGLGSVMKTTDSTGAVVNAYTYDVYGKTTVASGSQANDRQFAGQQTDPTGLPYLRARYYDPNTGSFLSRDPLSAGPAWGGNPFGYAGGNSALATDPSGLMRTDDGGCGGGCTGSGLVGPTVVDSSGDPTTLVAGPGQGWYENRPDGWYHCTPSDPSTTWPPHDDCVPVDLSKMSIGHQCGFACIALIGEYVNVGGATYRISSHAADRMDKRGITKGRLQYALDTSGKEIRYIDANSGECTSGFFSAATGLFIAIRGGEVKTVFDADRDYFDALKSSARKC